MAMEKTMVSWNFSYVGMIFIGLLAAAGNAWVEYLWHIKRRKFDADVYEQQKKLDIEAYRHKIEIDAAAYEKQKEKELGIEIDIKRE